jgi:hypothetical protein
MILDFADQVLAHAIACIVTSANSGPLAKARRRSCRIRLALRRDQISVHPSSPPLPVTSELIGRGRGVIPDTEAGPMLPRCLLAPPHQARRDP